MIRVLRGRGGLLERESILNLLREKPQIPKYGQNGFQTDKEPIPQNFNFALSHRIGLPIGPNHPTMSLQLTPLCLSLRRLAISLVPATLAPGMQSARYIHCSLLPVSLAAYGEDAMAK